MTLRTDDTLNSAWNAVAAGHEPDTAPGPGSTDAALLRTLHATASTVQPDPAFRDQLWADLSRRPTSSASAPLAVPSLPASHAKRSGILMQTPRRAPANRRWSPPIATIAAALVIALVGYGALSLSGTNPSGLHLDLNDVPNASSQGQGMSQSDNPVVGTWGWLDDSLNSNASSFPIVVTMTLDAAGGVTATAIGDWTGHGTWTASGNTISVQFSVLVTQEALKRQGYGPPEPPDYDQSGYVPNITVWTMSFQLSEDGNQWEDISADIEMGVQATSFMIGSSNPQFFVVSDFLDGDEGLGDPPLVRRLDNVIESAPTITAQEAGLESAAPEASTPPA